MLSLTIESRYINASAVKNIYNSMMIALGKEELYDIIREQGEIKVECEYCDKEYVYTKEDVDKLLGITNG